MAAQVLLDKRIAYTVNGSVYFSVSAFEAQGGVYGKLVPEQIGNSALLAEGEGALAASADCKQHPADFALWKAPKSPEEPSWPAPWGAGRPGWHIECSVMAQALRAMGGAGQDAKKVSERNVPDVPADPAMPCSRRRSTSMPEE